MRALDRVFRSRRGGQERPLAAQIAALFANGEQGLWYDPSALSTMYQDAAGTLPIYRPGQGQVDPPVGLILDKRYALQKGPNIVTNGTFDDTSGWAGVGATISSVAGRLFVTATASAAWASASVVTIPGRRYVLTVDYESTTGVAISAGTTSSGIDLYTTSRTGAVSGTLTASFVATTSTSYLLLQTWPNGVGKTAYFDNVSVREMYGNHAYQTTTASRPTLSAKYNLVTSSEFAGGVADLSLTSGVSATTLAGYSGGVYFGAGATIYAYESIQLAANTTYIFSAIVEMTDGMAPTFIGSARGGGSSFGLVLGGNLIDPASTYVATQVGAGRYKVSATLVVGASAPAGTNAGIAKYVANDARTFKTTAWDVRPVNDGTGLPSYQKVVNANTYDTAGFPLYLKFDGVDDFLQTGSVDFSGTDKVLVVAALRKFSDAATGLVFELSANSNTINGAFLLAAPSSNGVNKLRFASKGTALSEAITTSSAFSAPLSLVVAGRSDIAADLVELRANGVLIATGVSDQGTGNLSAGPVFIGRRGDGTIPFNGRLYGLLIRAGAANDLQIGRVERYLNQKAKVF